MFASVFVLARDAATLKRKRGRRRRRRRKLVRLFVRSLSFDDENKQNTDEEKQAMKILAPKKKTRGVPIQKNFLLGDGAIRFSLSLFLPCLWAALS